MSDPPRNARPALLVLTVLGAALVIGTAFVSFANAVPGNLDDAYITLVYARHLVEDQSLYWNLQDGPIDGFTSLLDVLVKAVALPMTDDPLAMARDLSLGAHVLAALGCTALVAATGSPRGSGRAIGAGMLTGLVVALHPAPAHGASFLLESAMFVGLGVVAAALPLSVDLAARPRACRAWVAVLMLGCIVRPEAQALSLLLAGLYAVVIAPAEARRVRLEPLAGVGIALLAYYGWHLLAFDALLPNTFHAKSSGSRAQELADGWAYLGSFAQAHGALGWVTLALPLLGLLPLRAGGWSQASAPRRHAPISIAAATTLLMVLVEGGDSYTGGRFLALPVALGLVACGHLVVVGPRWARGLGWGALGLTAALALAHQLQAFAKGAPGSAISASIDDFGCERQAAQRVASALPTGEVMQTDWQRLKFFEDDLRVVDLHGLNDRAIARLPVEGPVRYGKFTHAHALEVAAPLWVYGHRLGSDMPMAAVPMAALMSHPPTYQRFVGYGTPPQAAEAMARTYVPASFPVCKRFFNVLVHRDHAAALSQQGALVGDGQGRPWGAPPAPRPAAQPVETGPS